MSCAAATPATATGWRRSPIEPAVTVLWVVSDGKPGHLNQSLGLAEALQRAHPELTVERLAPLNRLQLVALACGRPPPLPAQPPALIVCAGHATHLSALALSRYSGAPSVVLMRPSLPLGWFSYALLARHDRPAERATTLQTEGAINRMRPANKRPDSGLILLGGPSRHYRWDEPALLARLTALTASGERRWQLSGSRRTPPSTLEQLAKLALPNLDLVPLEAQPTGWLADQLAISEQCWVSCDSVSMVYEALTAGCQTGLLALPSVAGSQRLAAGIDWLRSAGRVAWYDQQLPILPATNALNEADRAAAWLLAQPRIAERLRG